MKSAARLVAFAFAVVGVLAAFALLDPPNAVYYVLRGANTTMFIAVAAWWYVGMNDAWSSQPVGYRRLSLALLMLFLAGAYGSAESFVLHAGTGPRIPLVTLALLGILHGLWDSRHHDEG